MSHYNYSSLPSQASHRKHSRRATRTTATICCASTPKHAATDRNISISHLGLATGHLNPVTFILMSKNRSCLEDLLVKIARIFQDKNIYKSALHTFKVFRRKSKPRQCFWSSLPQLHESKNIRLKMLVFV